jgi:hypothetical protein
VGGRVFAGAATGGAAARVDALRQASATSGSSPARLPSARGEPGLTLRLADGSDADCRAGIYLAREAHGRTIFRDIPFSEDKTRAIYAKAVAQPERFGLIYAVPGGDAPLAEGGLLGFASVHAGEHFLGTGTLIATVQTLNISQNLTGTLLGGKVALRLVQAVRHWAKERDCRHLLVHVTNGENAADADRFFRRCGMVTVGGNYVLDQSNLSSN